MELAQAFYRSVETEARARASIEKKASEWEERRLQQRPGETHEAYRERLKREELELLREIERNTRKQECR